MTKELLEGGEGLGGAGLGGGVSSCLISGSRDSVIEGRGGGVGGRKLSGLQ